MLAAMTQVSLVGYAVGGAFLGLAYFDLPYYLAVIIIMADAYVKRAPRGTPSARRQRPSTSCVTRTNCPRFPSSRCPT